MNLIGEVHHIGYLVDDIIKSLDAFKKLGWEEITADIYYCDIRNVKCSFLKKGNSLIEIMEAGSGSEFFPLSKRYKNTPYHVCYLVDNIKSAIEFLSGEGFLLFKPEEPAPAIAETAVVAFLMHSKIGIVELLQM